MTTHAQAVGSGSVDDDSPNGHLESTARDDRRGRDGAASPEPRPSLNAIQPENGHSGTATAAPPQPTTITPTVLETSPLGSIDQVAIAGSDITVTGSAAADVGSVVVVIPRQADGARDYWVATTDVYDQHWKAVIETDLPLPSPLKTTAQLQPPFRRTGVCGSFLSRRIRRPLHREPQHRRRELRGAYMATPASTDLAGDSHRCPKRFGNRPSATVRPAATGRSPRPAAWPTGIRAW